MDSDLVRKSPVSVTTLRLNAEICNGQGTFPDKFSISDRPFLSGPSKSTESMPVENRASRREPLFHDAGRKAGNVGRDLEVARAGVTLGVKDIHGVAAAEDDVQVSGLRVEIDRAFLGVVHAAEVQG
jgi:hypothetical protein